jgi:hypothetical protein
MKTREAFKQVGALLLPSNYPEQVGLGCPKCDDHELVPTSAATGEPKSNETIQRFLKKHADCGVLEQLEVHDGKLGVTGALDPKGSS